MTLLRKPWMVNVAQPSYTRVLSLLGGASNATIIPLGDPTRENAAKTTVTATGGQVFTYSEARTAFTVGTAYVGRVPVVTFNGTDEEADSPDAAFWSRDDGSAEGFSVGAWVRVNNTAAAKTILSKYVASNREWRFIIDDAEKVRLMLADESAGVEIQRTADAATTTGVWRCILATYDGSGGATAANGITIYEGGAVKASTATNNASYVAMENLGAVVGLAQRQGAAEPFAGSIAGGPLGPFFSTAALTAAQVAAYYAYGKRFLG